MKVTIKDLYKGFTYDEVKKTKVFSMDGKLYVPFTYYFTREYFEICNKTLLKLLSGEPFDTFYFKEVGENSFEAINGISSIIVLCRFIDNKTILTIDGERRAFRDFPVKKQQRMLNTELSVKIV